MDKVYLEVKLVRYHGHSFEPCWNIKQNDTANKSLSYRKHLLQANYVLVVDIKTKTLKI